MGRILQPRHPVH